MVWFGEQRVGLFWADFTAAQLLSSRFGSGGPLFGSTSGSDLFGSGTGSGLFGTGGSGGFAFGGQSTSLFGGTGSGSLFGSSQPSSAPLFGGSGVTELSSSSSVLGSSSGLFSSGQPGGSNPFALSSLSFGSSTSGSGAQTQTQSQAQASAFAPSSSFPFPGLGPSSSAPGLSFGNLGGVSSQPASSAGAASVGFGSLFTQQQQQQAQPKCPRPGHNSLEDCARAALEDLKTVEHWPLTSYAHDSSLGNCVSGDMSFEEVRFAAYSAASPEQHAAEFKRLFEERLAQFKRLIENPVLLFVPKKQDPSSSPASSEPLPASAPPGGPSPFSSPAPPASKAAVAPNGQPASASAPPAAPAAAVPAGSGAGAGAAKHLELITLTQEQILEQWRAPAFTFGLIPEVEPPPDVR